MNYYEKLIQEKINARDYAAINKLHAEIKKIVDELRRKYSAISSRERDDGNFLYSIIHEKGQRTDHSDKLKAEHAAGLEETVRRMSTVPRDWGNNSKGETNMGYYADLIKEKKEKQNSIVKKGTFNKGTYTIDKTTGMFGRTVYIVHVHYEKGPSKDMTFGSDSFETLQDAQKYADRLNSKEEKDNENFHYLGKTFSVTSGNFQQVRQQVQKAYWDKVKELEVKLRSAQGAEEQRIEKELREIREGYKETMEEFDRFNNSKEQSYYGKLAEEKAERNNDKTVSLYGKNYSFGSDRQKNQQEFKKAQDDFNREYFKVKEEMDELQKELRSKRFKLDQQWDTFYSQVKGFLGL